MRRLIVIGGDAAGMSGASQARRLDPDLDIVVFERTHWMSYAACGIPYYIGGDVQELRQLQARTPEQFARMNIDVRLRHEVTTIDTSAKTVQVRDLEAGTDDEFTYDLLLYATGARPLFPPIEGQDLQGVHQVRTLDDARSLRSALDTRPLSAAVVGGGYIGLEVAEAFHNLHIPVTIFEMAPTILSRTMDPEMGELAASGVRELGIEVLTGAPVDAVIGENGRVVGVEAAGTTYPADIVVLGLGSAPNAALADAAGITLGPTGAVAVDDHQRTGADGVYAAGDCAEAIHRVTGKPVNLHLGTVANKQGRVAGTNLGGGDAAFPGVLGTAITKVADIEIARTGLTLAEATDAGLDAVAAGLRSATGAHYWPKSSPMRIRTVVERPSGRLLGAQLMGGPGAGKRIDTFAV
ncbi:MAG: FAD-dependent oxidoreductase, partial [Gammaproteobacteria bacterium]|nr:FAD-dependent oxidoreductase [Gammaproteobacteria bacterium]